MNSLAPSGKYDLDDGDIQCMTQNYSVSSKIIVPNSKNHWFNVSYRKQKAILKCIHYFDQEKVEARLEDLQNQVALWDHPHLVKVLDYEVCEKDTGHWVMICQGRGLFSLRDELDKSKSLDKSQVWKILEQVTSALYYAKEKFNAYHGNIKASNIIKFDEDANLYKLGDFGSKTGDEKLGKEKSTVKTGHFSGDEYTAPEYKGLTFKEEDLSPFANDIWALGILCLNAFNIKTEALQDNMSELEIQEYLEKAFLDLSLIILDGMFFNILQMMLNKNPSKRLSLESLYGILFNEEKPEWIHSMGLDYFSSDTYLNVFLPAMLGDSKKKKK